MRLDKAIEDYLGSLEAEGRSPRTVDAYRRDLALLRGELGDDRDAALGKPDAVEAGGLGGTGRDPRRAAARTSSGTSTGRGPTPRARTCGRCRWRWGTVG